MNRYSITEQLPPKKGEKLPPKKGEKLPPKKDEKLPPKKDDADWTKYPCVPKHPNAIKKTTTKGRTYYMIGDYAYSDTGKKWKNSTEGLITYSCSDETFKKKTDMGGGDKPSPSTTYKDCGNGPYKKGCKGTPISTIQECLISKGYTLKYGADGKFGKYTEEALFSATGKKEFTKDEVTTLCQEMKTDESISAAFGKEEQKQYWQDLKDKGQIYTKGITYLLKNGVTYVYIIKRKKDGTKVPIVSEAELNVKTLEGKTKLIQSFDEFDYEILYPINPAAKATAGEVGVLTAGLTQDDEVYVRIIKDNQGNWKPTEPDESFELSGDEPMVEHTIKTILKLRLFEQNVKRTIGSSSDPNKLYTVGGGTPTSSSTSVSTSTSTTQTSVKTEEDKKKEVKTVMEPKQVEVLTIMDELILYTGKYGKTFKGMKVKKFNESRELIGNMDMADVCSESNQAELKKAVKELDNAMVDYDSQLDETEESYLNKIKTILLTIPGECDKINKSFATASVTTSTPTKGVETSTVKTKEVVTTKDEETATGVDPEVKSFLEDNGYTFSKPSLVEKERLSSQTTVGQQLRNLDADGIYEEYYTDSTPIWKSATESFGDLKYTIQNIKSNIPNEVKREYCKSAIDRLYQSAFPSTRVVQTKNRSVIEDDEMLNQLKSAIIKCDEEKNFSVGKGGKGDELSALYRCRSNKKGRSYYGVDRYCLTDYKTLKQDNPTMQMESVVKKHIFEAIKTKNKVLKNEVKVESILREIKRLRK